jgi:hypothetical protein
MVIYPPPYQPEVVGPAKFTSLDASHSAVVASTRFRITPKLAPSLFGEACTAHSLLTVYMHTAIKTKKARPGRDGRWPAATRGCCSPPRPAAQRLQRLAHRTLHPAPIYSVVGLGVADQWLDGLPALEQSFLVITQRFVLAGVDDLHAGVVSVNAPVTQNDDDLLGRAAQVLLQDRCLLNFGSKPLPSYGLQGKLRSPTIKPCLWVTARLTLTPNSQGLRALPFAMHSTSGACSA